MKKGKYKQNKIYLTKISFWCLVHMVVLFDQNTFDQTSPSKCSVMGMLIIPGRGLLELIEKKGGQAVTEELSVKSRGLAHLQQVSCPGFRGPKETTSGAEVHHGYLYRCHSMDQEGGVEPFAHSE